MGSKFKMHRAIGNIRPFKFGITGPWSCYALQVGRQSVDKSPRRDTGEVASGAHSTLSNDETPAPSQPAVLRAPPASATLITF